MTTSRFLRYMDLKDEWEELAPEESKWLRVMLWSAFLTISLFIAAEAWYPLLEIPAWPLLVLFWVANWKWSNRLHARRDLLMQMRGLAYEPH